MDVQHVHNHCTRLLSSKVTERKKSADALLDLLNQHKIVEAINSRNNDDWSQLFTGVKNAIVQINSKIEKTAQQNLKLNQSDSFQLQSCHEILLLVIKSATQTKPQIDITTLTSFLQLCASSEALKETCCNRFIQVLNSHILSKQFYWTKIDEEECLKLLRILKRLNTDNCDSKALESIVLIVKQAANHKISLQVIKNELEFVQKVCLELNVSSAIWLQKTTIELALEFCKQNAFDNRKLCCMLGESVSENFISIYDGVAKQTDLLWLLLEFLLLQVKLHHPSGTNKFESLSYASSWENWSRILNKIWLFLKRQMLNKNKSIFMMDSQKCTVNTTFTDLTVEVYHQITQDNDESSTEQQAKRRCYPLNPNFLIGEDEQIMVDWRWLNLLSEILNRYPNDISPNSYLKLLQYVVNKLKNISQETRVHFYHLLHNLLDVETHLDLNVSTVDLWLAVYNAVLRSIGLNLFTSKTHLLLRKLIKLKKVNNLQQLVKMYVSLEIPHSEESICTLNVLGQNCDIPEQNHNKENLRTILLTYVMRDDVGSMHFMIKSTAVTVMHLILKQWPTEIEEVIQNKPSDNFEKAFKFGNLNQGIFKPQKVATDVVAVKQYILHVQVFNSFKNILATLTDAKRPRKNVKKLLHITMLSVNLIGLMNYYNLPKTAEKIIELLTNFLPLIWELFETVLENLREQDILLLDMLKDIFVADNEIGHVVKKTISANLIQTMFGVISEDIDDNSEVHRVISLTHPKILWKLKLLKLICIFAMHCSTPIQQRALKALIEYKIDPYDEIDYNIGMVILTSLKEYEETFTIEQLELIYVMIKNLLSRFQEYDVAVNILNILYDLYPHIHSCSNKILQDYVCLLGPFFDYSYNFGPEVTKLVSNCVRRLVELKNDFSLCKLPGDKNVVVALPKLLSNDLHEVRITVCEDLVIPFSLKNVEFEMLKDLFQNVCKSLDKLLKAEFDKTDDEVENRTASLLYTYANIIITNSILREKAIFALLKSVHKFKINLDSVKKVLSQIATNLNVADSAILLEAHLNYIFLQWNLHKLSISEIPFKLFSCKSTTDFCIRYMSHITPILMCEEDSKVFDEVCTYINKSPNEVIEEAYPKVVAKNIIVRSFQEAVAEYNITPDDIKTNACVQERISIYLSETECKKLLIEKVDEVIVNMIQYLFDQEYYKQIFGEECRVPEPETTFLNTNIFMESLAILNEKMETPNLFQHIALQNPSKLQAIILKLHSIIQKSCSPEEKISVFFRYCVFVQYFFPYFKEDHQIKHFLIRDITFRLINNIRLKDADLQVISARFFLLFIDAVLPESGDIFQELLIFVVSNIVTASDELGEDADAILEKLFVTHVKSLDNLKILDPLPNIEKFERLHEIHDKIKRKQEDSSLRNEIGNFLKTAEYLSVYGDRTEGLRNLHQHLIKNKKELKVMYEKLYDMRGNLSEKSVLHDMICILIKSTGSNNAVERLEAARCLGELGTADLTTMVLKSEENLDNLKDRVHVIALKGIISLLHDYIFDENVDVVTASSKALYQIMQSADGAQIVKKLPKEIVLDLFPFISNKTLPKRRIELSIGELLELFKNSEMFSPKNEMSHNTWIVEIVTKILGTFVESSYFQELIPIAKLKVSFAEEVLPLLVNNIIEINYPKFLEHFSTAIGNFFKCHWDYQWNNITNENLVQLNRSSVQIMLNTVYYVRLQRNISREGKSPTTLELDVNYLHVALAAQYCSAHFSAIMFAELWCQKSIHLLQKDSIENPSQLSPFDLITTRTNEIEKIYLNKILRKSYEEIGDRDALHNSRIIDPLNITCQINSYIDINRWDLVLLHYQFQANSNENHISALKNIGLLSYAVDTELFNEPAYECLWRLGQWDVPTKNTNSSFELYNFQALKALKDDDVSTLNEALTMARNFVIKSLQKTNLESCKNLYEPLMKLQCLQEIEEFCKLTETCELKNLLEKWRYKDSINTNEFKYFEQIVAHRISVLNILQGKGHDVKEYLVDLHINLAESARLEGNLNIAKRSVLSLLQVEDLDSDLKDRVLLEDARITWQVDKKSATYLLKQILDKKNEETMFRADALKTYGTWMAETNMEGSQKIIADYFLQSLRILNEFTSIAGSQWNDQFYDACDVLANFADQEYQEICNYTNSSVFQLKVKNMEKSIASATKIRETKNQNDKDVARAIIIYERQSGIDKTEIDNTLKEKDRYLQLAFKYYLINLVSSDKKNMRMFRVFSLWLANRTNVTICNCAKQYLPSVPTYKLLLILPQIIPHITNNTKDDAFGSLIYELVEKCALDHPHHAIPIIMSVANSNKDKLYGDPSACTEVNEPRILGAQKMIKKLKSHPMLKNIIQQIEETSDALIQLAYYEKKSDYNTVKIPPKFKIMSVKNFNQALLPTYNLPIKPGGNYGTVVGISKYVDTYEMVGGLNAPKCVKCIGSDGKIYMQLVKGKDDLRQDAVMQQVFTIMNSLFRSNKSTTNLLIRTYKIIPLSKRSGVLEWVTNSMPLGKYLVEKNGAHSKYNPGDWSTEKCKAEYMKVAKASIEAKLDKYLLICKHLRPAFYKFFEMSFPQPTVWYQKRQAYTQSVATSSMCGYILGLGDRHVQNILIDKDTAEVIHIDFGIAFEQGKILPTPETVPFRLTRDIESGMGITGVEGTFRRSCEKTMEVLRNNTITIQTILEVLLYDPLYAWSITPQQAYSRQLDNEVHSNTPMFNSEDNEINLTAERALSRLQEKLQGTEFRGFSSVEGQVARLIQQARDPGNLCRMFYGWQPYL